MRNSYDRILSSTSYLLPSFAISVFLFLRNSLFATRSPITTRKQERRNGGNDIEFAATRLLRSTTCRIHIRRVPFVSAVVHISVLQTLHPCTVQMECAYLTDPSRAKDFTRFPVTGEIYSRAYLTSLNRQISTRKFRDISQSLRFRLLLR